MDLQCPPPWTTFAFPLAEINMRDDRAVEGAEKAEGFARGGQSRSTNPLVGMSKRKLNLMTSEQIRTSSRTIVMVGNTPLLSSEENRRQSSFARASSKLLSMLTILMELQSLRATV